MRVCQLQTGIELHADIFGNPYLQYKTHVGELSASLRPEWVNTIEAWQASSKGETARKNGDKTYQAASAAAQRCKTKVIESKLSGAK